MVVRCLHLGGIGLALLTPLLLNPWAALPFEPVKVGFVRWVTLLLLLLVIGGGFVQWRRRLTPVTLQLSPVGGAVLFYGLVLLVTTTASHDPLRSWWGASDRHGALTTGCGLLLCGLLQPALRSPRHVSYHLLAWVAGSVPVCLYGLMQASGFDPLPWQTDSVSPVLSTLGRSNTVGAYLAMVLPLTLHLAWIGWRHRRGGGGGGGVGGAVGGIGVILLLQLLCLALTQARAGWLAFLGGVTLWWWYAPLPQTRRQRVVGLLLFGLITVGVFMAGEYAGTLRFTEQTADAPEAAFVERRNTAIERRWLIWQHTLPLIQERWQLGYGPELFAEIFNRRYPPGSLYDGADRWIDDPHNLLLDQLMASGILGALAWLILIGLFYQQTVIAARRSPTNEGRSNAAALLGGMTAYVLQAQFNPDTIVLTLGFWLLLTYCTALRPVIMSHAAHYADLSGRTSSSRLWIVTSCWATCVSISSSLMA